MSQPQPVTGTAPAQEDVARAISAVGTHSVSSQILGQVFNPLVRRFNRPLGVISYLKPSSPSVEKTSYLNVHMNPLADELISTWIRFVSQVEFQDLCVEMVPADAAPLVQIVARYAWIPSVEQYPATDEEISTFPTNCTMTAGPMFVGGRVNKEILPVEFSYLLQKQIKPPPYVGGTPRLAMRVAVTPCMIATSSGVSYLKMDEGRLLYNLNLVATLVVRQ